MKKLEQIPVKKKKLKINNYEKTFKDLGSGLNATRNLKKPELTLVTLRDNF